MTSQESSVALLVTVIPVTPESEVGESLESGKLRLQLAEIMPLALQHSEGASKVTRGWGLGQSPATGLLRCFPIAAALLPLQGHRDPNPNAEDAPKSGEGSQAERQAGIWAGGGLSWLRVPGQPGQARSRQEGAVALAGALCTAQAGLGAARGGCRQHRGARGAPGP